MNCGERKAQLTFCSFWRGLFDYEPALTFQNVEKKKKKRVNTFYQIIFGIHAHIFSRSTDSGVVENYVHYTTDELKFFFYYFFYPPHTQSVLISTEKKMSCQILYNNFSSCPRKWSPYNTHHREAKDTQVKSTLKSRLSTNQTLSNRLFGCC